MRAEEDFLGWDEFKQILDSLWEVSRHFDCAEARELLLQGVKGYKPTTELEDLVWRQRNGTASAAKVTATVTTLKPKTGSSKGDRA